MAKLKNSQGQFLLFLFCFLRAHIFVCHKYPIFAILYIFYSFFYSLNFKFITFVYEEI